MRTLTLLSLLLLNLHLMGQEINYSKFKGEIIKINQVGQLDNPHLYDYQANSSNLDSLVYKPFYSNTAEAILTLQFANLLANNNDSTLRNFIRLKSKFSFIYHGNLLSIIKYQISKDSVVSKTMTVKVHKKNNVWGKADDVNKNNIEFVFRILSTDAFWQFYNKTNNPAYPQINALKPQVQDANGVLNIEKLAAVIKANKTHLAKYLDE